MAIEFLPIQCIYLRGLTIQTFRRYQPLGPFPFLEMDTTWYSHWLFKIGTAGTDDMTSRPANAPSIIPPRESAITDQNILPPRVTLSESLWGQSPKTLLLYFMFESLSTTYVTPDPSNAQMFFTTPALLRMGKGLFVCRMRKPYYPIRYCQRP